MIRKSNYQDILKIIALICMIIDHIGFYFFPKILILRAIGRYAFPVFCFFAGFNFKGRLRLRVLIYGILIYIFAVTFIFKHLVIMNILVSIFIGYVYLSIFKSDMQNFWKAYTHFVFLSCCWPLTYLFFDYGTLALSIMVLGYSVQNNCIKHNIAAFSATYVSCLCILVLYLDKFAMLEFIITAIVAAAVYFSLACDNFHKINNFNFAIINNNLLAIYCIHLVAIMVVWRYYVMS